MTLKNLKRIKYFVLGGFSLTFRGRISNQSSEMELKESFQAGSAVLCSRQPGSRHPPGGFI